MTLKEKQALPLQDKIQMTEDRILEWILFWEGLVYLSFSGGLDSTVLLHIIQKLIKKLLQKKDFNKKLLQFLEIDLKLLQMNISEEKQLLGIPVVFVDTGLEYPEIRDFVKTKKNIVWLRPDMPFPKVLEKYGYPVGSKMISVGINRYQKARERFQFCTYLLSTGKYSEQEQLFILYIIRYAFYTMNLRLNSGMCNSGKMQTRGKIPDRFRKFAMYGDVKVSEKCCDKIKKKPLKKYTSKTKRKAITGTRAVESKLRELIYNKQGCNAYESETPISSPLSFWTDKDIKDYIQLYSVPYSKIYDMGETRTGCMFCPFGVHLDKGLNRFQRMAKSHPKQYKYCIENLDIGKVLDFIGVEYKRYQDLFDTLD